MIKELQQRPFARPLIIWIAGILLQVVFPCFLISSLLVVLPLFFLGYSYFCQVGQDGRSCYAGRWIWGAVFASLLLSLSIQKTAFSQKELYVEKIASKLQEVAKEQQLRLLEPFSRLHLTEQEKSILATITIGHRESMDKQVRKQFAATGVAHILSVSGFHVAVVCGFLSFFFSFLPAGFLFRVLRFVLTICLLWMFVYITGLEVPAVRAGIMLTLYLTGRMLRRATDGYNTLAASAFCMLVYEPLYLFDVGFQLSYLAVLSILYLQPRLKQLPELRNPLLAKPYGWVTMTLAAQAGTTFLCLYYFGQFPLVFLFTNLPLTLLATVGIPVGLTWMLLPSGIPGYDGLQWVVEVLTHEMLHIVDIFSRVPGGVVFFRFSGLALMLGYGFLFFLMCYERERRPRFLLAALTLLLIFSVDLVIEKLKLCGM